LRQQFSGQLFSVAEIANIDGAMPTELWNFLNNPQPSALRAGREITGYPPLPPDIMSQLLEPPKK
jgi:hypothetical protein